MVVPYDKRDETVMNKNICWSPCVYKHTLQHRVWVRRYVGIFIANIQIKSERQKIPKEFRQKNQKNSEYKNI